MEARVAGVPEDEESGLLPRPSAAGRRPSAAAARRAPPPPVWATVDGPLGLPLEEAEGHARRFFLWGFACLPFLWAINCCYFWPVLRSPATSPSSAAFSRIRPYVVRSAIGFTIFSVVLLTWATTFIIGGERLFGPGWNDLVMYNVADKLGISGFMG
ncbi:probable gamma-secretase subunit PEN-2 [Oryza glaberrima]|uniref:Gamma-secretase subunit PEN-2 n=4 Tax=Oryza TaxID=4527 RepID=A0A0D3EYX6_9ORYZ|nr:probable gamma-secretase subunit PEN-2 [Oryza glaberrima]